MRPLLPCSVHYACIVQSGHYAKKQALKSPVIAGCNPSVIAGCDPSVIAGCDRQSPVVRQPVREQLIVTIKSNGSCAAQM